MKMKYEFRRSAAAVLCLLLCVLCLPRSASAYTRVDTGRECSLTLEYGRDGTGLFRRDLPALAGGGGVGDRGLHANREI